MCLHKIMTIRPTDQPTVAPFNLSNRRRPVSTDDDDAVVDDDDCP